MAVRCEDYPACGHTDGLPCDWKADMDHYHSQAAIHYGCDHEAGWCTLDEEEEED
jgi:hypothetical protein